MDQRVAHIVSYIKAHPEKRFSLKELAGMACLSPIHFHRLFKKELGITPGKFVEKEKVTKGYALLIESKHSVQDIAATLGYNDYETFSKNFKKYYQISPNDVRMVFQNISSDIIPGGIKFLPVLVTKSDESEMVQEMESLLKKHLGKHKIPDLKTMAVVCEKSEHEPESSRRRTKYKISHDNNLSDRLHKRLAAFLKANP